MRSLAQSFSKHNDKYFRNFFLLYINVMIVGVCMVGQILHFYQNNSTFLFYLISYKKYVLKSLILNKPIESCMKLFFNRNFLIRKTVSGLLECLMIARNHNIFYIFLTTLCVTLCQVTSIYYMLWKL